MISTPKSKSEIRREVKSAVKQISPEQKRVRSSLIFKDIAKIDAVANAETIALYASLPDEVVSFDAIDSFAATKHVVLPRVDGDTMDFYPYTKGNLKQGAFGIDEPQDNCPIAPEQIDVIIIPGVSFTKSGKRLGRGKGYYDKYLSKEGFRGVKVGICYTEQLVKDIPDEPHDIVMDCVIHG